MPQGSPKKTNLSRKQPLQRGAYQALIRKMADRAEELDLSVRALAELLNRPRTTVHKTLTGQRRMDPIEFLDWCEVLEFDDPIRLIRSLSRR